MNDPTAPAPMSSGSGISAADGASSMEARLQRLYPRVDEAETPLPKTWSSKDKYSYIGLSQNNLRVQYKGI